MRKSIFTFLTLTTIFAGCNNSVATSDTNDNDTCQVKSDTLTVSQDSLQTDSTNTICKDSVWTYSLQITGCEIENTEQARTAIHAWINKCLGGTYEGDVFDYKKMEKYYSEKGFGELDSETLEMCSQNSILCSSENVFNLSFSNENLVTISKMIYWYGGGAHGGTDACGVTFNKKTGHRYGWDMLKKDIDLQETLQKGLYKYFDVNNTDALSDNLQFASEEYNVTHLPLPATEPWIDKDGLHFQYQQYEIACYAAGMPEVTVPLSEANDYLTDEFILLLK